MNSIVRARSSSSSSIVGGMKFFGCLVDAWRAAVKGSIRAARGARCVELRTHCSSAAVHGESGGIAVVEEKIDQSLSRCSCIYICRLASAETQKPTGCRYTFALQDGIPTTTSIATKHVTAQWLHQLQCESLRAHCTTCRDGKQTHCKDVHSGSDQQQHIPHLTKPPKSQSSKAP